MRVQQLAENAREWCCYRVTAGEKAAVMTTAWHALAITRNYSPSGVAETDIVAAACSARRLRRTHPRTSKDFRTFVLHGLFAAHNRPFSRDRGYRLPGGNGHPARPKKIAERAEDGTVRATHAQLAAELGTAREVISRQLAEFQRRGWVDLGRGTVTLL